MMEFLLDLLKAIALAAVPVVGAYIAKNVQEQSELAKEKTENETVKSILDDAAKAVMRGVAFVSQTYVDTLKKDDAFSESAQEEAFRRCLSKVKSILTETAKTTISKLYGDLDEYLRTLIEAEVKQQKVMSPALATGGDIFGDFAVADDVSDKTEAISELLGLSLPALKTAAAGYGIDPDSLPTKGDAIKAIVSHILTSA